ncbi:MAG: hypothetical protein ACLRWM_13570 [Streptococcus sp.]
MYDLLSGHAVPVGRCEYDLDVSDADFYMDTIIPEKFLALYHMNPMYQYINFARICIIDGVSPNPISYLWCILTAVVVFAIGVSVFRKNQNRFVLYL